MMLANQGIAKVWLNFKKLAIFTCISDFKNNSGNGLIDFLLLKFIVVCDRDVGRFESKAW